MLLSFKNVNERNYKTFITYKDWNVHKCQNGKSPRKYEIYLQYKRWSHDRYDFKEFITIT